MSGASESERAAARRRRAIALAITLPIVGVVSAATSSAVSLAMSPVFSARMLRRAFDSQSVKMARRMEAHATAHVASRRNVAYRDDDPDAVLDVFWPADGYHNRPIVIWMHGGGWLSGSKSDVAPYLQILASRGFVAVGVDYTIAPVRQYPCQLRQVADAVSFVARHATQYGADASTIILAGDSAGAHLAAQIACASTNPDYAEQVGVRTTDFADGLAGCVLACGMFDVDALWRRHKSLRWFVGTLGHTYAGSADFANSPLVKELSLTEHVTSRFPPTFITAGNGDPLEAQSRLFAQRLHALDVPVQTAFFDRTVRPRLGHEYQFHLETPQAVDTMEKIVAFMAQRVASLDAAGVSSSRQPVG